MSSAQRRRCQHLLRPLKPARLAGKRRRLGSGGGSSGAQRSASWEHRPSRGAGARRRCTRRLQPRGLRSSGTPRPTFSPPSGLPSSSTDVRRRNPRLHAPAEHRRGAPLAGRAAALCVLLPPCPAHCRASPRAAEPARGSRFGGEKGNSVAARAKALTYSFDTDFGRVPGAASARTLAQSQRPMMQRQAQSSLHEPQARRGANHGPVMKYAGVNWHH